MTYLIADIGNTLTKFSLLDRRFKIIKSYNIETYKIKMNKFKVKFLKNIIRKDLNNKILISSVVPKVFNIIKLYLKKKKYLVVEIKDLNLKKLIKLKVDNTKNLGSDRIANAIGSYSRFNNNCIVIDFGTATTFDVINRPGVYEGGVIAPGIKSSIINLNKSTALLPLVKLKKTNKNYGKNTQDALNSGFIWGYQGLINNIIKKINSISKKNYKVVLTGGYANIFKKYISCPSVIDQNITIKGIIKIYKVMLI
jgi:type III pantothenate kinase